MSRFCFSNASNDKLNTCHQDLRRVMRVAIASSPVDFGIACGFRNEAEQNRLYELERSLARWPRSFHNRTLKDGSPYSWAVDITPYIPHPSGPGFVDDRPQLYCVIAGVVLSVAKDLGVRLVWGGDWNGNWDFKDQKLVDLGHFQIQPPMNTD